MQATRYASSFSLPAKSSLKERPARPFLAALTALTATLTVAMTAFAPAPASAQAGAYAETSKTAFLLGAESQNLFGATEYDIAAAALTAIPPQFSFFDFSGFDLTPQDRFVFAFANSNFGYAEEVTDVSDPFDVGGLVAQGTNTTQYTLALAPEYGLGYGGAITYAYAVGDQLSLIEDVNGEFKPAPYFLFLEDYNYLVSETTKPEDFAYSFSINETGYEYLLDDYETSIGGTTLYGSAAQTVNNAFLYTAGDGVYLSAGSAGSAYYEFFSDETWVLNALNGFVFLNDNVFVAGGDFAFLPWSVNFYSGGSEAFLFGSDWGDQFSFLVAPDVAGDPDGTAALFITNVTYTESYAVNAVPEPSVVVTGILFGLATVGGVLRGRARRS